jgi:hypothetical protein
MSIFDRIISSFYQVDLHLAATTSSGVDIESMEPVPPQVAVDLVVHFISKSLNNAGIIERQVLYGRGLLRLTFSKEKVAYSRVWRALLALQEKGLIHKYVYRHMDMEEALATIIATEKLV